MPFTYRYLLITFEYLCIGQAIFGLAVISLKTSIPFKKKKKTLKFHTAKFTNHAFYLINFSRFSLNRLSYNKTFTFLQIARRHTKLRVHTRSQNKPSTPCMSKFPDKICQSIPF